MTPLDNSSNSEIDFDLLNEVVFNNQVANRVRQITAGQRTSKHVK